VPVAETSEYYTYHRLNDEYEGLSLKTHLTGKPADKSAIFKLNLVYTSAAAGVPQTIRFYSVDNQSINATLSPAGVKPIDNKRLMSNAYTINVTDSLKTFFTHQSLKQVLLFDSTGKQISTLAVAEPSFLIKQFAAVQAQPIKRKPLVKKSYKHSS